MKKKLFWAFLAALMLVLAASTALAAVTEPCPNGCGDNLTWSPYSDTQHQRFCGRCGGQSEFENHTFSNGICTQCDYEYCGHANNDLASMPWEDDRGVGHVKYCIDCHYPLAHGWHSGGTATCTQKAVCNVCNHVYGNVSSTNHAGLTGWEDLQGYKHSDHCFACGTDITGDCYDNNSDYKCDACGGSMPCEHPADKVGYRFYSDQSHKSYCTQCNWDFDVTTRHSGGMATCVTKAVCDYCNHEYGNTNSNHTNYTEWTHYQGTKHVHTCNDCSTAVYENCYDDNNDGKCDVCSHDMSAPCTHPEDKLSAWSKVSDTQHARSCTQCNNYTETKNHTGGTATCTQKAVCDVCNTPYGDKDATNHTQFTSWEHVQGTAKHMRECTNCGTLSIETGNCADSDSNGDGKCDTCGYWYNCSHPEDKLTAWRKVSDTQHARSCQQCNNYTETKNHTFTVANCQSPATCTACGHTTGEKDSTNHANISPNWLHLFGDQHYKPCLNCWGNSGEKGTCSDANGDNHCDLCNNDMSGLCRHPEDKMSGWRMDPIKHYKECTQCYNYRVYDDHTGGVGTCSAWGECTLCGANYVSMDPNNHVNLSDWASCSDTQHERHCLDCNNYTEYENHTGGTATCTEKAVCDVCGESYGDLASSHATLSDWASYSDTQHERHCLDCNNYTEYENHTGGTATCTEKAVCDVCDSPYGEFSGNHVNYSGWKYYENDRHVSHCLDCNDPSADLYGDCADADGNGKCDVCGHGETAVCTHPATAMSAWRYADATRHSRTCTSCNDYTEYGNHTGGTATCINQAVCTVCRSVYGGPGAHASYSDWEYAEDGQHVRYCLDCEHADSYQYGDCADADGNGKCDVCGHDAEKECSHWFGQWTPKDNGAHMAECMRAGCDHVRTVFCDMYEVTVTLGETETTFAFCHVCGDFGDAICEAVADAAIQAADGVDLPRGELIVRGTAAPFEGALYAFTAGYEFAGKVEPFKGAVAITLPLEMAEAFKLVRVDAEGWTELEFTYEDGLLTFETEVSGLFLLVPAEEAPAEETNA